MLTSGINNILVAHERRVILTPVFSDAMLREDCWAQSKEGLKRVAEAQSTNTSISPISPSGEAYKHNGHSPNEVHKKKTRPCPP